MNGDFEISGTTATDKYSERYEEPVMKAIRPKAWEYCYFDLETIPDFERFPEIEEFLPPLTSLPDEIPADEMVTSPEDALTLTIGEFKDLLRANPDSNWLSEVAVIESNSKKPRKGIQDAIAAAGKAKGELKAAQRKRLKVMSTVPEMCKVVAFCTSNGLGDIAHAALNATTDATAEVQWEPWMLAAIWSHFESSQTIVGYNCLAFDLPVLIFRSALLGVEPTRSLDLRKFSTEDVIDLYLKLAGTRQFTNGVGSQDAQCKLAGIKFPEDAGFDGSQVLEAVLAGELQKVEDYVRLDVKKLVALHRHYRGFYWD